MNLSKGKSVLLFVLLASFQGMAQGTLEEYQKSASVESLFQDKVFNVPEEFHWMDDNSFWYVNNARNGNEYLVVRSNEKVQEIAFDHARVAASLSKALDTEISKDSIDIDSLAYGKNRTSLLFSNDSLRMSLDLNTYEVTVVDSFQQKEKRNGYWGRPFDEHSNPPVDSPDGKYTAYIKNSNLYIKDKTTQEEHRLSYDGSKGFFYSSHLKWSPDSKKIVAYKVRPGEEHKIYFVESRPSDQLQPRLHSEDYLKPGDALAFRSPQLFKVDTREHIAIPTALFDQQYRLSNIKWEENSSAFTFEYNQRGHQVYRVLRVDAEKGEVRPIIEEVSPTFIDYSGKKFRHDTKEGKEVVWASERDGWNHLYLIDRETGKLKNQITKGNWPVREVLKVDEENRQIYFTASGLDKGNDPYYLQYCRIDFDGKNFTRFTTENADHRVTFSPDYSYYIDTYSRVDQAPVSVLRKTNNQKQLLQLQEADISELLATGWQKPEPFMAKGRDGKTDIWGIIVRPTHFDPAKTYPIIEYIYAGPHSSFVPKDFNPFYVGMSELAELGFIVVKIDGMGTSNRSKAFHDVAWKNLKDAGFPDRKLWIKAAAEKYPYMNTQKVGIHGRSAGGQSSSGALIFNSDFYDVAVSSAGCHDNRMDKIWWNEQWMGHPVGPHYEESSNIENAAKMNGKLLLIVGEMDTNVDPASTFQFADALIKANKDFDLLVRPGVGHSAGNDEYDIRKRKDFFVKHLMGVNPPSWDEVYNPDFLAQQKADMK